eukprot:CAMPEP_0201485046 /NCGR_PEP_ID=MMETSP0151_2-20130828/9189_1 /ASSEMBLY_ACC=CAM_ASM_000257 /TAXON_ID=200890 /ORGANISM="Paramoeba atlantica, Strain 621/1 / CCAP 1560/9" /LENGTH=99 /DNA_ID=CAMNT_0047868999 /DNA_START=148 /DNA_END=447 /DNA_ORIENTATION=+
MANGGTLRHRVVAQFWKEFDQCVSKSQAVSSSAHGEVYGKARTLYEATEMYCPRKESKSESHVKYPNYKKPGARLIHPLKLKKRKSQIQKSRLKVNLHK